MKTVIKIFTLAAASSMLLASCVKSPKTVTLDFEGASWDALIDNPQNGGKLLYGTLVDPENYIWEGAENYSWSDGTTGLEFPGFPDSWGSRTFSSGGEAISNYVNPDYSGKSAANQLEIPVAPKSGKNFVVHYGNVDPTTKAVGTAPLYPMIKFSDNQARVIKSMDICLTNYLINSCVNGDAYFGPISGETTIYAKAIAFDASGKATLSSTIKLIEGTDAEAYKAGSKKFAWKTWDLSALGATCGLILTVTGTDDCYGEWGFNAPSYFAYDNVVVEMPEE